MPAGQDPEGWQEALRRIEKARRSNVTDLDLSGLKLKSLPDSLARLELQGLNLDENQLTTIPDSVLQLGNLEGLYMMQNQMVNVPDSLHRLRNLRVLVLHENQIATFSDSLLQLTSLERLDLSDNRITAIPNSLTQLRNLDTLDLSYNQITAIPDSLTQLTKLTLLDLHGNPSLGIPDEILDGPLKDILAYYFANRADSRPLNEAKLILVGQGGVGKSSLVKALITGKFNSREKTTEGIKITDWSCPLTKKDPVTLHIWDFGGQEMMHSTHQFFLTARSLYLLVLNRRNGGYDKEADYWFRLIRAFGGKDAPVIVVLNKQRSEPFDVNRGGWLEKYAGNIRGFVETDCADAKTITRLKRKIQEQLGELKNVKAGFPGRWFAIKDELAHLGTDYVTFEAYREICRRHGEADPEKQTALAGFLHDLGIALNYKDDPRLRFAYVLKPEWVTGGIYSLLHAFITSKGLFTRDEAERTLARKNYPPDAAHFILGLMEQFELSFPLGDAQKRILIPQLLGDQQPDLALDFKLAECLNFGYQYPIVPEGLLPRFIVRTHHLSDATTRWKSGVILRHESSGCRALVRTDVAENQVRIHIDGPEAARRELLAVIRHNFDAIHRDYDFHPDELVYPPGVADKPLVVEELKAILRDGNPTLPVMLSDRSVRTLRIAELIEPVKSAPVPLRLFLSYAHADERYLEDLRKGLKVMERNGLLRTWHDRELTAGEKWKPRILQELNQADVIVCQISPDFLASDFCMLTELDAAIKRQEDGETVLIGYVLKDCLWREVKELKQFQILPKDAKPLGRSKDKYWREVGEGIQKALEKLQQQRASRPDPLSRFGDR
jgi:internalin A